MQGVTQGVMPYFFLYHFSLTLLVIRIFIIYLYHNCTDT